MKYHLISGLDVNNELVICNDHLTYWYSIGGRGGLGDRCREWQVGEAKCLGGRVQHYIFTSLLLGSFDLGVLLFPETDEQYLLLLQACLIAITQAQLSSMSSLLCGNM